MLNQCAFERGGLGASNECYRTSLRPLKNFYSLSKSQNILKTPNLRGRICLFPLKITKNCEKSSSGSQKLFIFYLCAF